MGSIASKIRDAELEAEAARERVQRPLLTRLAATREAGTVRRCHIVPHHGQYNIAQHSYGAVSLLLLLHPKPSLKLIKAVQWHDVAERWLGDVPAPAKWTHTELGEAYERAEEELLKRLGLFGELTDLEVAWLKAVDTLELWLWCREEEEALGNAAVTPMRRACEKVTEKRQLEGSLPAIAAQLYDALRQYPHKRLSDFFEDVEPYLQGETK